MKTSDEMCENLFRRREEYEKQKRVRNKKIVLCASCFCLAVLVGIGVWKSGIFKSVPVEVDNSGENIRREQPDTPPASKEQTEKASEEFTPPTDLRDIAGYMIYENREYVQCGIEPAEYPIVLDKKIGSGEDFEGTYNREWYDRVCGEYEPIRHDEAFIASQVYTVKDEPDLLCVKLANGGTVILKAITESN